MRQLLTQLYVTSEDAYLSLDGENVVVSRQKTEIGRVPLHTLEGIVCFSRSGASPALMGKCAAKGIDLCFFSPYGQFLARTVGEERGNSHSFHNNFPSFCGFSRDNRGIICHFPCKFKPRFVLTFDKLYVTIQSYLKR